MGTVGPDGLVHIVIEHYTRRPNGEPVAGALVRFVDQVSGLSYERGSDGGGYSNIAGPVSGHPYTWSVFADGYKMFVGYFTPTDEDASLDCNLTFKTAGGATTKRRGVVRIIDRVWTDDDGPFRPLGATLFWSVWGWQNDQMRLRQTLEWLSARGVHFIRILGDVDWSGWGMQMDSSLPNWERDVGQLIDCVYDEFNMRTEFTLWGGSPRDPINCASRVLNILPGREHKILALEMGNECFQNGPDDATLKHMLQILGRSGMPRAASSPGPDIMTAPEWIENWLQYGADKGTIHPDRTRGEHGERCVRQMHDFGGMHCGANVNEPIGPRSSVDEEVQPTKLAMMRAMSIFYGCGAYVLHNGNGVSGQPDPTHNRGGDLWTVPGIDEIHLAVWGVDAVLPVGVETWPKSTQHGGWAYDGFADYGQPLAADAIWSDGIVPWGCDRCYGGVSGGRFVTMVSDIVDYVVLRASHACDCVAYDCGTGKETRATLEAGGLWQLDQHVAGTDLIINGTFR